MMSETPILITTTQPCSLPGKKQLILYAKLLSIQYTVPSVYFLILKERREKKKRFPEKKREKIHDFKLKFYCFSLYMVSLDN